MIIIGHSIIWIKKFGKVLIAFLGIKLLSKYEHAKLQHDTVVHMSW